MEEALPNAGLIWVRKGRWLTFFQIIFHHLRSVRPVLETSKSIVKYLKMMEIPEVSQAIAWNPLKLLDPASFCLAGGCLSHLPGRWWCGNFGESLCLQRCESRIRPCSSLVGGDWNMIFWDFHLNWEYLIMYPNWLYNIFQSGSNHQPVHIPFLEWSKKKFYTCSCADCAVCRFATNLVRT